MITYRISTELKNLSTIEKIINDEFSGYTLIKATGYWKLKKEKSLLIEIITDKIDKIKAVAKRIKKVNHQEAIYIQKFKADSILI